MVSTTPHTFQEIIASLKNYWATVGCALIYPIDIEVGAGTFHPATFLRTLGPKPWSAAYVQPCRRPNDGRYGENPNRVQHYYQFQAVIKPSPLNIQEIYLASLRELGIDTLIDDIQFVEDNWESPTIAAWGLGWEVRLNGMEITQFTYFQQMGGIECNPTTVEITYGLERIAMHLQNIDNIYDIVWHDKPSLITYGDMFLQNEKEMSCYNFTHANSQHLYNRFADYESECKDLLAASLVLPAYEMVLKTSHIFNLLNARGALAVTERQNYILRVRALARMVAEKYCLSQEKA